MKNNNEHTVLLSQTFLSKFKKDVDGKLNVGEIRASVKKRSVISLLHTLPLPAQLVDGDSFKGSVYIIHDVDEI